MKKKQTLTKVYTEHLFRDFEVQANQDYEVLLAYLKSNWGSKGKSKKRFNKLITSGREWTDQKTVMWFYLQKENYDKAHSNAYNISLVFKLKDP